MPIRLPDPIAAYVDANVRFDLEGMLAPFAADAVVADEKKTHRGRAAIRDWIKEATFGNRAVAAPQTIAEEGADHVLVAQVSGEFPGSPVTLTFRFTLQDGMISRLEIH
jgi:hypothetical protein